MVTNKEHPHNELSREEIELKIEELIKKMQNNYGDIFDELSPIAQIKWNSVLLEARLLDDKELVFDHLNDLTRIIDLEVQEFKKETEKNKK